MEKILLHCPPSISRPLSRMVENFCSELAEKHNLPILLETQPYRTDEKSLFETYVEEGNIPALTVGHVNDIAEQSFEFVSENCRSLPGRFPLKKELSEIGFDDREGHIHPFAVGPFVMCYNRTLLSEEGLPRTWKDLLSPRWQGKVLMPDDFRTVSLVIRAFMETYFPEKFEHFQKNFVRQGSPLEMVSAVDEGAYPICVTDITIARISRLKKTRIIWPEDGFFGAPQVMIFSKTAPEPILEVGEFLMSPEVQEFLTLQGFVGTSPEAFHHPLAAGNRHRLKWEGWRPFLSAVRGRYDDHGEQRPQYRMLKVA